MSFNDVMNLIFGFLTPIGLYCGYELAVEVRQSIMCFRSMIVYGR